MTGTSLSIESIDSISTNRHAHLTARRGRGAFTPGDPRPNDCPCHPPMDRPRKFEKLADLVSGAKAETYKKREKSTATMEESHHEDKPATAVNAFCMTVATLDCHMHRVLDYYTSAWMPSSSKLPERCQIAGLSPVRTGDDKVAFDIVQNAFQSHDETSLYALLAASARRLRAVHGGDFSQAHLPDLYSLKAITALRRSIAARRPVSSRTILDLSFLLLSEFLDPSTPRCRTYRNMLFSAIIALGGIQTLPVFIAQAAMAFDSLTSAGALTKPALDPFRYPRLVCRSGDFESYQIPAQDIIWRELSKMDERIQVSAVQAHSLWLLVDDLEKFPTQAIESTRQYLRLNIAKIYRILCEPLQRCADGDYTQNSSAVVTADLLYMQIRSSAWRRWVLCRTLRWMSKGITSQRWPDDSPCVMGDVSPTWEIIGRVRILLEGSGWRMPPDVVMWIAAVRYLTCNDDTGKQQYQTVLWAEASKLEIASMLQLENILSYHLPLDDIQPGPVAGVWGAISEERVRT